MNELLHVGEWTVHPALGRICSRQGTVALEPRLMQLLLHLAAHPDRVLPKEHLLEAVWKDTFVAENTLMNAVSELRKALGDDVRAPRFIHTHAKRGYRLIAPVRRAAMPAAIPTSGATRLRLAVAPFSSNGPTDTGSVLAGLLTELVSTQLARSSQVSVVSRLSVSAGRRQSCSLPELAARLGAQLILEGAVSSSNSRVWISARLFDVHDESLWGELMEFEGEPGLAIEAAASGLVARIEATPSRFEVPPCDDAS